MPSSTRRPTLVQQVYGYAVCLIAIVVGLIAVMQLLNAAFDLTRPTQYGRYGYEPGAASFEQYKLEHAARPPDPRTGQPSVMPPDSVLRRSFEEERAARMAYAHWETTRSFVTHGILLLIAIVLFVTHWRWLRRVGDDTVPSSSATL